MTFSLLIAQLINGLQTGSVYALVALGYSMVYGIIKLLNFAHGDIIMIGAYMVTRDDNNVYLREEKDTFVIIRGHLESDEKHGLYVLVENIQYFKK